MTEFCWGDCETFHCDSKSESIQLAPDQMDRARYAAFLTDFLIKQSQRQQLTGSYVLNLNAAWGTGKSYFLRRWANDLRKHYPTVYVDAWANDSEGDPLLTVIAAMLTQLRDQAGKSSETLIHKTQGKALALFKGGLPILAKGLGKRYLGVDSDALADIFSSHDEGSMVSGGDDGVPIELGELAAKAVEGLIADHDARKQSISQLKKAVNYWIGEAREQVAQGSEGAPRPAFVLIDELDRCRPSFAVEMLEVIKHIFDLPNVVFVVATDTGQLRHAIGAVYGSGFDGERYLGRFFHSRFTLPEADMAQFLALRCDWGILTSSSPSEALIWPPMSGTDAWCKVFSRLFKAFEIEPRTAIQLSERLLAIVAHLPEGEAIDPIALMLLLILHERMPEHYQLLVDGKDKWVPPGARAEVSTWQSTFQADPLIDSRMEIDLDVASVRHFLGHYGNGPTDTLLSSSVNLNEYLYGTLRFVLFELSTERVSNNTEEPVSKAVLMKLRDGAQPIAPLKLLRAVFFNGPTQKLTRKKLRQWVELACHFEATGE